MKKTVRILLIALAALFLLAGGYAGYAFLSFRHLGDRPLDAQGPQSGAMPQIGREYTVVSCSEHDPVAMRFLLRPQPEPTPEDR